MKKLILIDGNAIVHRAYHALPPLNSKDGKLTNAVYGFFSMVLKILNNIEPDYFTVCFDRPKPTFRKELYVGYQAQRPEMDDDLVPQIGLIHEILEKAKVQIFELDGYEADDLIGTISVKALKEKEEIMVIIVSGDRDLLQLVNRNVKMLAPITGITKMLLFDKEKVEEKYGLSPSQMIDYKALVGDSSDNYPGVLGIGPKTAANLLKEYKTFENLYKNLNKLPEKLAVKLANDAEQAALAKKLATIVIDAPISLDIQKTMTGNIDNKSLLESFKELNFKSLINRLSEVKPKEVEKSKKDRKTKNDQLGFF
ncbi:MAG: 5'-3' exonuclease H3TH domain-containing protein [Candidatus Levyibacteriota bacterium]